MPDAKPTPCKRCKAPTVEIGLAAGERRLIMRSCSRCDHRVWLADGAPTVIHDILASVASTGRRRSA